METRFNSVVIENCVCGNVTIHFFLQKKKDFHPCISQPLIKKILTVTKMITQGTVSTQVVLCKGINIEITWFCAFRVGRNISIQSEMMTVNRLNMGNVNSIRVYISTLSILPHDDPFLCFKSYFLSVWFHC